MFTNNTTVRVRYGETDQMGYLHHGNYPLYYEVGRLEALRNLGFSYAELEKSGVMMPVLNLDCTFIKPVFFDDLLTIKTTILELPSTRMKFRYELFRGEVKVHEGHTELCFVDSEKRRPKRCPDGLIAALKSFY